MVNPFGSRTVSCAASVLGPLLADGLPEGLSEGLPDDSASGGRDPDPPPSTGALDADAPACGDGCPEPRSTNQTAAAPIARAATAMPAVVGVSHRPPGRMQDPDLLIPLQEVRQDYLDA
ncbi:hypothetical protein AB0N28_25550, partial [Streptomyces sp. NPDC051130]